MVFAFLGFPPRNESSTSGVSIVKVSAPRTWVLPFLQPSRGLWAPAVLGFPGIQSGVGSVVLCLRLPSLLRTISRVGRVQYQSLTPFSPLLEILVCLLLPVASPFTPISPLTVAPTSPRIRASLKRGRSFFVSSSLNKAQTPCPVFVSLRAWPSPIAPMKKLHVVQPRRVAVGAFILG